MCVSHVPRLLMFARTLLLPAGYQELSPTRDDGRAEVASRDVIILRRCRRRPGPNTGGAGTQRDARRPPPRPRQAIVSAVETPSPASPLGLSRRCAPPPSDA